MSEGLINTTIQCPYCWQTIDVVVDDCGESQQYIEDCQVCCRPINFHVQLDEQGQLQLQVYSDDD